jgi:DNA-binding transcriptional MerR regulator
MRSSELASVAGVTVRTLRHYHQVGVLAEPERGSNGYRHYDVHDLVRLLRIKRLAAMGIALDGMAEVLDAEGGDHDALLGSLESELDARIQHLESQRELVRAIRATDASPDLPPMLAPFIALYTAGGASAGVTRIEREQAVLLAHLVADDDLPRLVEVYERLADPALSPAVLELSRAFEQLEADADDERVDTVVQRFVAVMGPLVVELAAHGAEPILDEATAATLLGEYQDAILNRAQRLALARVGSALAALTAASQATRPA